VDIKRHILPIIVLSQFAGTSTWFAGNAVLKDITTSLEISRDVVPSILSAVQLGFITGTLLFSIFTITDRFSPSRIFFFCSLASALSNLSLIWVSNMTELLASRYLTGFFLAGIYPVGMKIAADYNNKGLGKALGYLVGALVLGTAFPHLLNATKATLNWHYVIFGVSLLSCLGGIAILTGVPNGPYRTRMSNPDFLHAFRLFRNRDFRLAAFGYFGHMWELYTFWALVPLFVGRYINQHAVEDINVSLLSFAIIGAGSLSCVAGGHISIRKGNARTAFVFLLLSGLCCLLAPFALKTSMFLFVPFMLLWGMSVVADSPQFTSIVAQSVDSTVRGSALTLINSIGFAITIVSVQVITAIPQTSIELVCWLLATGPLTGLISLGRTLSK